MYLDDNTEKKMKEESLTAKIVVRCGGVWGGLPRAVKSARLLKGWKWPSSLLGWFCVCVRIMCSQ
jgi:hypothetical protein